MDRAAPISANTLFHFTNSVENLTGILHNNFYPRYCLEDHSYFYTRRLARIWKYSNIALPMVCFCDIPLSNIRSHISVYGNYAIGLSKAWGEKKQISPIMYALKNSVSAKVIRRGLWHINNGIQRSNAHLDSIYAANPDHKPDVKDNLIATLTKQLARVDNGLVQMMGFTKNYTGSFVRGGRRYANVRFYDEREWRYMPDSSLLFRNNVRSYISKEVFLDDAARREANDKLARPEYALDFEMSDVRYIVVSKHSEIIPMMNAIDEMKGPRCSEQEAKVLTTRIISTEQILEDF